MQDNRRPIHYLGSKLRLLDEITKALDELDPSCGRVCDLFCGSGTVSYHLAQSRSVVASDIQTYSQVLCDALMLQCEAEANEGELVDMVRAQYTRLASFPGVQSLLQYEQGALRVAETGEVSSLYSIIEDGSIYGSYQDIRSNGELLSLVTNVAKELSVSEDLSFETQTLRYFGGLYFSYKQSLVLDAMLMVANSQDGAIKQKCLAATLSTASEIVNTVGNQFAQPLKVRDSKGSYKRKLAPLIVAKRNLDPVPVFEKWLCHYLNAKQSNGDYSFLKMDYAEALQRLKNLDVSAVYADPPYTRYHYSRYYHVLETMCLRDMPKVSNTCKGNRKMLSRAMYRDDRHQSPFCIKSKAEGAFEVLFSGVADLGVPLVLSYSPFTPSQAVTPRLQTIDQLVNKALGYFDHVVVRSPGEFTHSKFNSSDKNFDTNHEAELLIMCH